MSRIMPTAKSPAGNSPAPSTAQPLPPCKASPYWIRKMRTLFRRLDHDGTGALQVDHILDVPTELMATFPKISDFQGDQIVQAAVGLWYGVFCTHVPEIERTTCYLSETNFVTNIEKVVATELKAKFSELLVDPFFIAVDADEDGKITNAEFRGLMKAWCAPERDADTTFKMVDKDRDGKITLAEFNALWADYFFSDDQKSPYSKLWGVLVNYKRPEDYGKCECGPVWEGKIRTMFRRLDVSGHGKLKCHDFIQIARGIIQRGHLEKKKGDAVIRSMLNLWVKYIAVDKEGRHLAEITEKEFLHNMRDMINGPFRHEVDQFGWTFFKAVEVDGNGYISAQEYRNLQESWKVAREEADGMFKVIDTDKDGNISSDEYLSAFLDYFLGEDPKSPFKSFFGPVIAKFEVR